MSRPTPDPLLSLAHVETHVLRCGRCPEDVAHAIEMVRKGLRERLAEPEDPMEDAAGALQLAQARLRHDHGPHLEAIQYALAQAAASLGHARILAGRG